MTSPTSSPRIILQRDGPVLQLTLNCPEQMNRIDEELHARLGEAFLEIATMDDLRALVLASTGPNFSVGGDFEFILRQNARCDRDETIAHALSIISAFLDIPVPVVVALHGDVMGLATSLVLCSEAVVTHPGSRLSDPHVAVGLVAGDGGCLAWPLSAGMLVAKRYLITGDPIPGALAHQMGLVTDLVETPADVLPRAREIAARIAELPPIAVQGTKRALNHLVRERFAEVMSVAAGLEVDSLASADVREAISAFREKRRPTFQGA